VETKVHRAGSTFSKRLQVLTVLANGDFSSDSIGRAAASAKVAWNPCLKSVGWMKWRIA
jgi:hypothetical protein